MSFTCKPHGWGHAQIPCPVCSQEAIPSASLDGALRPAQGMRSEIGVAIAKGLQNADGVTRFGTVQFERLVESIENELRGVVEAWPIVFGFYDEKKAEAFGSRMEDRGATHTARLAFLRGGLKKEDCAHDTLVHVGPLINGPRGRQTSGTCGRCGAKLIATWEELVSRPNKGTL